MPITRYRLYVDEVGTDDFNDVTIPANRYLGLTGVAYSLDTVPSLHREIEALKHRHFQQDPDDGALVLHRSDIVKGRGPFQALRDPGRLANFGRDWIGVLERFEFTAFTILVDKLQMLKLDPGRPASAYAYAMERLTERFVHFLARRDAEGDIMPEMRKGNADAALQATFANICSNGTGNVSAAEVARRLPASNLKFRSKRDNVAGLQVADSVAHPSAKFIRAAADASIVLSAYERRFADLLTTSRYDRSPQDPDRIWGYGIEAVP